jgi:hypothetical protein
MNFETASVAAWDTVFAETSDWIKLMPKKTITERVLAANRENGKKSIGPRTTVGTRYNAVTHSLLAKKILFRDESEQGEFAKLGAELSRHHEPIGPTEGALVSEMAIGLWRLHHLYGWELLEVSNREKAAAAARFLQGPRYFARVAGQAPRA